MKSAELRGWLERLEAHLARLDERIAALEGAAAPAEARAADEAAPPPTPPAPPAPPPLGPLPTGDPGADEVTLPVVPEDVLLLIAAAVAAALGEHARVRQVRLIASAAWAMQGRVIIQASHRLF